MKLIFQIILCLLFIGNLSGQSFYIPAEHYNYSIKTKVARVIDGDTFVLTDSTHVRLLAVDTPELHSPTKPVEPYADSAYFLTRDLVEGKIIRLSFEENLHDIFGRLLAYTWILKTNGKDSLFLQAELLKKGYARIRYYPQQMKYYEIFLEPKKNSAARTIRNMEITLIMNELYNNILMRLPEYPRPN